MNDDLKAYVDGELPPEAAARLREALDADPALAAEAAALRWLSAELRRLPEPEPVGRAATLAAIGARRPSLARSWSFALAACAAVVLVAARLDRPSARARVVPAGIALPGAPASAEDATIPAVRREAFVRYVRGLGGMVRRDGDGLRAFYPPEAHEALKRRFGLSEALPWPTDGLRVRLERQP